MHPSVVVCLLFLLVPGAYAQESTEDVVPGVPFKEGDTLSYEQLEKRFGPWARLCAMICYLLTQVTRTGSIMFGVALVLRALLGLDAATIILVMGVLVTLYTMLGGIEAVIWTDVIQSIVLTVGAIVIAAMLLFGMPEGPGQVFASS